MRIEVLDNLTSIEAHYSAWWELFHNAECQHLMSSPDFCINWLAHFCHTSNYVPYHVPAKEELDSKIQYQCFIAKDEEKLHAIVPLRLLTPRWLPTPKKCLMGLLNSHTFASNFLVRSGRSDVLEILLKYICDFQSWDILWLGAIPVHSWPFVKGSLRSLETAGHHKEDLEGYLTHRIEYQGTFSEFVSASKKWKKIKYYRRTLEKYFGALSIEVFYGSDALSQGFPIFIEVDAESWKASKGEALSHFPAIEAYYQELVSRLAALGYAEVWVLKISGEPAAATLHFSMGGVQYLYKISFKEKFVRSHGSPGIVLCSYVLEQSWGRNRSHDFMGCPWAKERLDAFPELMPSSRFFSKNDP